METTSQKINDVMDHPEIPNAGKVLYHLLARRADEHGFVYATLPELARQLNMQATYIPTIAAPLEELGYIRRESAKGHGKGRKRYVVLALAMAMWSGSSSGPAEAQTLASSSPSTSVHMQSADKRRRKAA